MDYDDDDYTNVDDLLGTTSPRTSPRMLPAVTATSTVSYRVPVQAAALGRITLIRAPARAIGFKR